MAVDCSDVLVHVMDGRGLVDWNILIGDAFGLILT